MMATEATSETFAKSSTIPDHELNTTESASVDVSSTRPVLNGISAREDGKQDADSVEPNVNSAEVSISGGSDTEASKAETSKTAGDDKSHLRTASTVKKFASFKPVSVNKTFLAAKGAIAAVPSKLGDKISAGTATAQATTTATLRPRLVAKSGTGLRDASSRTSPAVNGGLPGAPDGSVVWNKNRPAPPPEPKAYTDEELQQRYGIHLATRIQKDDVHGKQANWADIDDDDDDWAPDSMEWADGTKITLPQADEHPPPAPAPAPVHVPAPVLKEFTPPPEPIKPKSPAPPQASASPIIKPGGLGSGRTGLVLKGASEKPTLVAKPPGPPAPVKSPWASLPPVDKPVPIVADLPQQQQQPPQNRFGRSDPHGFQGMPPPPAKEIAADDFSRTWREGNSNANRELYDSKSGRYEPVNDNRRGSRNDARHSLLQRPSHDGPAEPSAAFQTHRAQEGGGYGRRRTSSNVSGGSGFLRRMSRGHDMPPPHDLLGARRGSLAAVSDDPSSPRNFSPSGQNHSQRGYPNQQWQSKASPALSHPSPMSVHVQPVLPPAQVEVQPAVPYEDPIEEQKKIMRASRELAIKRRHDEEAKEEAERKERLRLKLEAMGPPPEKKSKTETPVEDKVNPIPVQIQTRTPNIEKTSEVVDLPKVNSTKDEQLVTSKAQDGAEIRANGEAIVAPLGDTQPASQENQTSQKWQNASTSGSDRYQPWAPQPTQQTSRNVWGPPTNDRTLGNGTFSQDLGGLPEMPSSSNPGPIGPPNRGNGFQRGGRDQNLSRPAPIGPPNQRVRPPPDARVAASPWANHEQYMREDERKRREENVQAEKRRVELEAKGILPVEPVIKDTWRQVGINEDGTRTKILSNHTTIHDDNPTASVKGTEEVSRPIFEGGAISEEPDLSRRRQFDSIGTQPRQPDAWAAPSRSRFFPSQDVRLESRQAEEHIIDSYDRPGSPSPPPPTMPGHPVYGDNAFPQVSFPKPPPVVKLPPPTALAPIGPPRPTSFAAAVSTPVSTPIRQTHTSQDVRREVSSGVGGWQDRINTLIGRRSSPPKTHALQVDSSSKNALELPPTQFAATVSLPSSVTGDLSFDDGSVLSKPAAEECFEEQEMGSLPVVKVPAQAPPLAWNMAPVPKQYARNLGHLDIVSISDHSKSAFGPHYNDGVLAVFVKLPGQDNTTTLSMKAPPRNVNRPGASRGGRGSRQNNSSRTGSGRGRNDGRDGRQDSGRDSRDSRQESGRNEGRDNRRDVGRDSGRDYGRDAPRDHGRDAPREHGRDAGRDAGRDSGRDVGRDNGFQSPPTTDSSRGITKGATYKSTPWTL